MGFVAVSAVIVACGFVYVSLKDPVVHEEATLAVKRGTPVVMIADQLERAGVIKNSLVFTFYARATKIDRKIKAGEYEFASGLSALDVLRKMEKGECKLYKITLIEGWTMKEMADHLGSQSFAPAEFGENFLAAAKDKYFVRSLGVPADTAEGYLFPSTYLIERPQSAEFLVSYLVNEFKKIYTSEFDARAKALGMTEDQVITLASIIEKETGADAERSIVSSVFHNRLKKNMLLQTDPTIIYGLTNYDGNIRKSDILDPHPYNTYVHPGLPPGPIANPSLASIKAALWPADTNYLFFVSRNDGTHEFSETLANHSKAVARFQLKR